MTSSDPKQELYILNPENLIGARVPLLPSGSNPVSCFYMSAIKEVNFYKKLCP